MTNNANKREVKMPGELKQKLTAAIAMLLVSAIMLVSATYAWFTLSTAPEVRGIQTSIGANGSLEMALLTKTVEDIKSGVGDSSEAAGGSVTKANLTWGNLVDLSDVSYGFNALTLNPARLMLTDIDDDNQKTSLQNTTMLLGTADYGADGRVSAISAARSMIAVAGTYAGEDTAVEYGVRAIGDNSALSPEEVRVNQAKIVFAQAYEAAKSGAKKVIDNYGEKLATIAVKHGTGEGAETYTRADVELIVNVITALESEAANIEAALKAEQIVRFTAADGAEHTEDEVNVSNSALTALKDAILDAKTSINNLGTASEDGTSITSEDKSYTWEDIRPAFSAIINSDSVTVNGTDVTDLNDQLITTDSEGKNQINAEFALTIATNPSVETKAGILVDIADFTGKYTSVGFSLPVTAMGLSVTLTNATLTTATDTNPATLADIAAQLIALKYTDVTSSNDAVISDNYGYAVDLAFRSNAAGNLRLRTDAASRIYQDTTVANPNTQGRGSNMTFASTELTDDQIKGLMGAVRVVFTEAGGTEVYGIATLDTANAENVADGIKANLVMSTYTVQDGKITVSGSADDDTITNLEQGEAKGVTAIVYLDGDMVDNGDIAATASTCMTGSLNLQFSSSAELKPMNYSPLNK